VTDIEVTDLSADALYPKVYNLRVTHSVVCMQLGPAGVLQTTRLARWWIGWIWLE